MTILICPTMKCNFKCTGCFEPDSQRHGEDLKYNREAIIKSLHNIWSGPYRGSDVSLHGGEPTFIPRAELEALMSAIYDLPYQREDGTKTVKGSVSIVTNGSKIDDYMIYLFKKYNVYVAVSCDGPPELNIHRGPDPSNPKVTREYNEKLWKALVKLRESSVPTSLMCILHKDNASTPEKLEKIKKWLLDLRELGITSGRINLMYTSPSSRYLELSPEEATKAWIELYEFNKRSGLRYNPFMEMVENLKGRKLSPCIYCQCDYFSTKTITVLPDGTIGNCDRTFQEGIYLRSASPSNSGRYEALKQTQCKDCRFWPVCYGGCPAEGVNDDWRNKTRFCEATYNLYSHIELELRMVAPEIKLVIDGPITKPSSMVEHMDSGHGDSGHGDSSHGDSSHGDSAHGDSAHGDAPHGDSNHGDVAPWRRT